MVYTKTVERTQWAKAHFFIAQMPDILKDILHAKVTEIAQRVGDPAGIEIVDVQVLGGGKARLVRIYIDKPEGVTHSDCQLISNEAGAILDAEDIVPDASYTLEVSSPGVERKLSTPRDFERFTGKKAKIVLREPIASQLHWEGTLAGCTDGMIALDPAAGERVEIPLAHVQKANLKFEW